MIRYLTALTRDGKTGILTPYQRASTFKTSQIPSCFSRGKAKISFNDAAGGVRGHLPGKCKSILIDKFIPSILPLCYFCCSQPVT